MAKAPAKKAAPAKKKPAASNILSISETILGKLRDINAAPGLQSDIVWCIGSYHHDQNPVGLFEKAAEALPILKEAHANKTKGITAKLIGDIEKALAAQ